MAIKFDESYAGHPLASKLIPMDVPATYDQFWLTADGLYVVCEVCHRTFNLSDRHDCIGEGE